MRKLYGYAYDFLVSYDGINVADVLNVDIYFNKDPWYKMFGFFKIMFIGLLTVSIIIFNKFLWVISLCFKKLCIFKQSVMLN